MSEPLAVRGGSLRIGDAERDEAVSSLSEHFVAGRLTQEEFEERSNQATQARYADEVELLFADLPDLTAAPAANHRGFRAGHPRLRTGGPPPFLMIVPVLMVGLVVSAVVLAAPWLLWMLFWIALFSGPARHRHWHQGHRRG
ncbi:DUF1707 SHOCT-like domain-containing protein [Kribbella catacumbae]|uniref:DUF1707 SHOCT-like domain-containing protein n=1 Tax=Kribbella catacumbae TaxID=460086 RepID=UPI00036FA17E|nr:DUF1707 domain-containing protein [Kribbella catacumbae]